MKRSIIGLFYKNLLQWNYKVRSIGYIWGVGGVLLLLVFAIYRLAPMAIALQDINLSPFHWAALLFSVCYMAYAEGYKGFHLGFAPRVVSRARYLFENPKFSHTMLAPLFCMGYFHTTRKRQLLSFGLTIMIVCFILIARQLPQPWRGILDAGVVVGLGFGISSIGYFLILSNFDPAYNAVSPELPGSS